MIITYSQKDSCKLCWDVLVEIFSCQDVENVVEEENALRAINEYFLVEDYRELGMEIHKVLNIW